MFDDQQRLRDNKKLLQLLTHYGNLGAADREVWQDRLMQLDGVEPKELTKLHGELIAWGWIDQNTGATPILKPDTASSCYRITLAGQRAIKQAQTECLTDDNDSQAA